MLPLAALDPTALGLLVAHLSAPRTLNALTQGAFARALGLVGVDGEAASRPFGRLGLADRLELLSLAVLLSCLDPADKLVRVFGLFCCGSDGRLTRAEAGLAVAVVVRAIGRADPLLLPLPAGLAEEKLLLRTSGPDGFVPQSRNQFVAAILSDPFVASLLRGLVLPPRLCPGLVFSDQAFPAKLGSLAPRSKWLRGLCLPPADRIVWRRCPPCLGTERQRSASFVSDGALLGGILASEGLLSGIAMVSFRRELFSALFPPLETASGRCSVRLFVDLRWEDVVVDDRLPFLGSSAALPLFSRIEGAHVQWVGLLEKALAKLFGSYAHLAHALQDERGLLSALRLLTGGHVYSRSTNSYSWKYSDSFGPTEGGESIEMSAFDVINKLLDEGAVLGLRRSDSSFNCGDCSSLPAATVYPITGLRWQSNELHLVLVDRWGGRGLREFLINARDVSTCFDRLLFVRFPDLKRTEFKRVGANFIRATHWKSLVYSTETGDQNSAAFSVSIIDKKRCDYCLTIGW